MSRRNDLGARRKSLKQIRGPASQVVEVSELKNRLRIESSVTDDDALLLSLIKAAERTLESLYGLRFITQTLSLYRDDIPFRTVNDPVISQPYALPYQETSPLSEARISLNQFSLLVYPVQSIESFEVIDEQNSTSTYLSDNYYLDEGSNPSRLLKKPTSVWPTELFRPGSALKINFTAGFGASASDVPEEIKMAVLKYAELMYLGCSPDEGLPNLVKALMSRWKRIRL